MRPTVAVQAALLSGSQRWAGLGVEADGGGAVGGAGGGAAAAVAGEAADAGGEQLVIEAELEAGAAAGGGRAGHRIDGDGIPAQLAAHADGGPRGAVALDEVRGLEVDALRGRAGAGRGEIDEAADAGVVRMIAAEYSAGERGAAAEVERGAIGVAAGGRADLAADGRRDERDDAGCDRGEAGDAGETEHGRGRSKRYATASARAR